MRLGFRSKGVLELEAAQALDEARRRSGDRPWSMTANFRSTF